MVFCLQNQEYTHISGIREAAQFCLGKLRNFARKCEINEINVESRRTVSSRGALI